MRMGQGVRTGLGHGGITCVLQTQFSSLCLTRIIYRFKQCNWHNLDAAADPTGQCHRL